MGGVRIALCAVAVLLAVVGVRAQEKGPASIAGRVTVGEQPLPNVRVELVPMGASMRRKASNEAVTGSDGRFRLTDVKPGRYSISVAAPLFIMEDEASPFSPGKTVIVAAGETVEDVNLGLTRGGVISGRVTNADGDPLVEESLTLFSMDETGKRKPFFSPTLFFLMRTDDRGMYRIFGLRPGRYLVAVGRERRAGDSTYGESRLYPLTFHPNAVEEAQAKSVEVAAGEMVADVDITVGAPLKVFAVTGRVVDGTGVPVANVMYGLAGVGEKDAVMGSSFRGDATNAKGEIRFIGVPAGRYKVSIQTRTIAGETGKETYVESPTFEVKDTDVSGVEVKLLRGQTVSGTVLFEGGFPKKEGTRYMVNASGDEMSAYTSPASVNPDGTFTVKGVTPGKVKLYLVEQQQEGPAVMSRIVSTVRVEHNGARITDGIEVAPGTNLSNVRIVVALGSGVVRGQVKLTGAELTKAARVIVFLRRLDTPTSEQGQKRTALVHARNRFLIENIVPGTYEISVSVEGDPTVKGKSEPQTVTVANGRDAEATLTLDVTNLEKERNQ